MCPSSDTKDTPPLPPLIMILFPHAPNEFPSLPFILVLSFSCQKHPPPAPLSSAAAEWLMIDDP
ncbi:hypothetical protein HOY82DRAFT_630714 [Tuber indicum]|nr:hypothetical protein HOY82DRAFT_630714 [Tuber indicum]